MDTKILFILLAFFVLGGCGQSGSHKVADSKFILNERKIYPQECERIRHAVLETKTLYHGKQVGQNFYNEMVKKDQIPVLKRNRDLFVEDVVPCSHYLHYYVDAHSYFNNEKEWDGYVERFQKIAERPKQKSQKQYLISQDKNRHQEGPRILIMETGFFSDNTIVFERDHLLALFDFDQEGNWVALNPMFESSDRTEMIEKELKAITKPWSHPIAYEYIDKVINEDIILDTIYNNNHPEAGSLDYNSYFFNITTTFLKSSQIVLANFYLNQPENTLKKYFEHLENAIKEYQIEYLLFSVPLKSQHTKDYLEKIAKKHPIIIFYDPSKLHKNTSLKNMIYVDHTNDADIVINTINAQRTHYLVTYPACRISNEYNNEELLFSSLKGLLSPAKTANGVTDFPLALSVTLQKLSLCQKNQARPLTFQDKLKCIDQHIRGKSFTQIKNDVR